MSSSQPSTTTTKTVQQHVRFSDTPPVKHKGMRIRNLEDLFYSLDELAEMQELTRITTFFSNKELKHMDVDLRGLEPNSVSRTDEKKIAFVQEFLRLQRKLQDSDFDDRQASLRSFVRKRSKNCEKEALKLAKKDEAEAERIYKADNISWARADSDGGSGTTTPKSKSFLGSLASGFRTPSRSSSVLGRAA